jgi:4-amino-4-deoxy-L-arabinose transferase-like glycosyltransferase
VGRRSLAAIGLGALAARLLYLVAFMQGYAPASDADHYLRLARAAAHGRGFVLQFPFEYDHATAIRPPLFPTVLAAAMRVFGDRVGVAQGVNIVAGSCAVVLGAVLAARIAGRTAGIAAGAVLAVYPQVVVNDVTVLVESLAVLLVFAMALLLLDGRVVLGGITLGLLVLDRASAQWLVLVVAAWVLWQLGWRNALVLCGTAALVVAPWVVRNWVDVGGPAIVATNGFNLNASFSLEAQHGNHFVDAYNDPRFQHDLYASADELALDRALRDHALHQLRYEPFEVVPVAVRGVASWFELDPPRNTQAEKLDGRPLQVRKWTLPGFYLVTIAGIVGLVRTRRRPAAVLLALVATYFTVISVFSIAVPRLRSVFDAVMALGAGLLVAVVHDGRRATEGDGRVTRIPHPGWKTVLALATAFVLVAVGALVWKHRAEHHAAEVIAAAVARDAPALAHLRLALQDAQASGAPPRFAQDDLDRTQDLVQVLGGTGPAAAPALRRRVADALRPLRVARLESTVLAELSAAELLGAPGEHRPPQLTRVATRYDQEVRPGSPVLEPFTAAMRGDAIARAETALRRL